ncbi:DNA/RNA polymerase [Naviculisporaceae sp. PSN 640]
MTPEGPETKTEDVNPATADGLAVIVESTEAMDGDESADASHASLKYSLLGPSLTKAGQDSVDQSKVSEIIYSASKGSKFFNREEVKDKILTAKIEQILEKKRQLEKLDLSRELRNADNLIAQLELSRDLTQHIVHIDCDAFYAAVEQLDRPELKDVPFAVGGGVLTTCNYVARRFGCRSGMAGFVAKKLCPQLVLLPLNFDKYTAKAAQVREVLAEYDPRFESASIDEAYLNITEYCADHNMTPEEAVAQMREEVHKRTSITVSAGIAANARLAKICSNINKPNGQFILPSERNAIMDFMHHLPCRKVNGVGRVLERELSSVGVKTCGDIYSNRQYLHRLFGEKTYEFLIKCYLGLGRTNVQPAEEYERKSVGTESTFRDMDDPSQLREKLRWTAQELEKDMERAQCKGRTLCLKVKLHTYEVLTRQVAVPKAIHLADELYTHALPMLQKLEQEVPGMKLRLLGLRCTHLVSTKKPDTMAFFGLKRKTRSGETSLGLDEHEVSTVDAGYGDHTAPEPQTVSQEMPGSAQSPIRRHGKEITPNPKPAKEPVPVEGQDEWWDCPICSRPQAPDQRKFNEHIDLCLSRQTILDTIRQEDSVAQASAPQGSRGTMADSRKAKEKKRGRLVAAISDPRQKKLCFG